MLGTRERPKTLAPGERIIIEIKDELFNKYKQLEPLGLRIAKVREHGKEEEEKSITPVAKKPTDFSSMTKAELVEFAKVNQIEYKNPVTKSELLEICEKWEKNVKMD